MHRAGLHFKDFLQRVDRALEHALTLEVVWLSARRARDYMRAYVASEQCILHRQFGHLILAAVLRHSCLVQAKLLANDLHALELPYVLMTSRKQRCIMKVPFF
jgi:hypothetical protein